MRFFSDVLTYCVMLQAFICYCSFVRCFDDRARARACVCVVHWHCTAQLSMFNMEKRFRNKIIIIIIIIITHVQRYQKHLFLHRIYVQKIAASIYLKVVALVLGTSLFYEAVRKT